MQRTARTLLALATLGCALPAAALEVRSELPGFSIVAADRLPAPRRPQAFERGHFCANLRITPATAAGREAARLGWTVTSEQTRAGYTAVGAFSRGGQGTSGTCLVEDGNVVLYRGARVVAIVYEAAGAGGRIGGVVPALSPDRLRIPDFTPAGFETADLLLAANAVAVVPIAASETACGNLPVPNLRGKTVAQVRKAIAPLGWRPDGDAGDGDANPLDAAVQLRRQGQTEFGSCSGTGYGFCSVAYRHRGGARLEITTVGDDYSVGTYAVQCPGGR